MEGRMIKKQPHIPRSTPVGKHSSSPTISKKPGIRIIHIFAPEIIKTDVESFRELVQTLTGKPPPTDKKPFWKNKSCPGSSNPRRRCDEDREHNPRSTTTTTTYALEKPGQAAEIMRSTFLGEKIKEGEEEEEEMMWNGSNSGGFLNGFSDFDGFIQELGGGTEFPLLPMEADPHRHPHMHGLF